MNNHTPGPWEYKKVWQSPSYEIFHDVCHIANVSGAEKQNGGNARLIAAAPDMVEMLRETQHELLVIYHQLWARQIGDWGAQEQAGKINALLKRIEGKMD